MRKNFWDNLMWGEPANKSEENNNSIVRFLSTLSPGIQVKLQYDSQPPITGTFQGFEHGNVILTDVNNFPGLVRINPNQINAVALITLNENKNDKSIAIPNPTFDKKQ